MDKINFENLPSTNTPLDADTLNDMQSNIEKSVVAVGKTQPSTSEKVWIKKGKNLFDKTKTINGLNISSDGYLSADANSAMNYVKVNPGVTYTLSSNANRQWVITTSNVKPYIGQTGLTRTITSGTSTQVTIPSGHTYLYVRHYPSNNENNLTQNIQVEQGTLATTYEAYVPNKINTKNSAGTFENVYDEEDIPNIDTSRWTEIMLGYRYVNDKIVVYAGTVVTSFSNGVLTLNVTNLGLAERPDTVQLTANSLRYALRYDYDSSTATRLKIEVINNGSVYTYTGNVRFSMTVYGKLA